MAMSKERAQGSANFKKCAISHFSTFVFFASFMNGRRPFTRCHDMLSQGPARNPIDSPSRMPPIPSRGEREDSVTPKSWTVSGGVVVMVYSLVYDASDLNVGVFLRHVDVM